MPGGMTADLFRPGKLIAPPAGALALLLAACSQSPATADLEARIARAEARTAAAEQRIRAATEAARAPAPAQARAPAALAAMPDPVGAPAIGVNTVAFRERGSGPTNEIP
jgi:hypothetical protein